MILDRLEVLQMISFIEAAIPTDEKTGKNCLFIQVDGDKLICIGGGEFVVKKDTLVSPNTTEGAASKDQLPERFMIPLAELLGFKAIIKAHKVDCKKLGKDDENRLFVEIDDKKMVSHDGIIDFKQPKYQFKELGTMFDVVKSAVGEMPVMPADMKTLMKGFADSKKVEVSFTGHKQPVHFEQGNLEAILVPPVEKPENENGEQKTIDDE